jgi:hypothetical protein
MNLQVISAPDGEILWVSGPLSGQNCWHRDPRSWKLCALPQSRPGLLETLRVLPGDLAAVDFGMHAPLPDAQLSARSSKAPASRCQPNTKTPFPEIQFGIGLLTPLPDVPQVRTVFWWPPASWAACSQLAGAILHIISYSQL